MAVLAMSVAPPEGGRNRIMIYGPKRDGSYIVEFKTADGEALPISVPAGETRVLKYFQERMPYGLFVPGCSLKEPLGLTISPGVLATAEEVIE
jgi:hypothetical protein